ncbi:MAG: FISUMP domain-containing protein [Gammaproteobacteria bacterium]|nr:FISUMP domain-containing protein [Gammaproteobacteria bacterium]
MFGGYTQLTDERDGKIYKTAKIGEQEWMAENLAYLPDSGNFWAYDNDTTNISIHGYLYDWETANKVCPAGWHLPSRNEWAELVYFLGSEGGTKELVYYLDSDVGTKMKSTTGWADNGNGTNESGFNGFPSGEFYNNNDEFRFISKSGGWWSSSLSGKSNAWLLVLFSTKTYTNTNDLYKTVGLSVRCIKD